MRWIEGSLAQRERGFSLLEMMVAISILALALAALYQAASGATRNVRTDEKYAYGVELARSLLAESAIIPDNGINRVGETPGGYRWRVDSKALDLERSTLPQGSLHEIEVEVNWDDGTRVRRVVLNSVVEGVPL